MIPKSGNRFSEKIMLKQKARVDDSTKSHSYSSGGKQGYKQG